MDSCGMKELIEKYKEKGTEDELIDIINRMMPLICKFAYRLDQYEFEDMKQELIIALIVAVDELFSDSLEFSGDLQYKDRFLSEVLQACSSSSEEGLLKLLGLFKIEIEECIEFILKNKEQKDNRVTNENSSMR